MDDEQQQHEPDEYHGIGGEYVRDPITGKRSPKPADPEPTESTNRED